MLLGWILAEGELWNVSLKSSLNRYDYFKGKENESRKKKCRKLSFQCIISKKMLVKNNKIQGTVTTKKAHAGLDECVL